MEDTEEHIKFKVGNWFSLTHYCQGYQPPLLISRINEQVYYFEKPFAGFAYYSQINSLLLSERNLESFGFSWILSEVLDDLKYYKDFASNGNNGSIIINVTTSLTKVQVFINGLESIHYWSYAHEMQNAMKAIYNVDILPSYSALNTHTSSYS